MNEIILGIDFGTTNTCVTLFDKNKIVILDFRKEYLIPTKIFIDKKNNITCGLDVIKQNDGILIDNFKLLINSNKIYKINNKDYKINNIILIYLNYIKNIIRQKFKNNKIFLVISVPSNFDNKQRNLIKNYFIELNLNVLRIINEPTAAAFYYSLKYSKDEENILVIDIGGGTTDLSILEKEDLFLEIIDTYGINLGGKDFTKLIFNNFIEENKNIELTDHDKETLLLKCNQIKKRLFYCDNLNFTFKNKIYNLSHKKLKKISNKLINKFIELLKKIKNKNNINKILLIGGSSKLNIISETINNFFDQKIELNNNSQTIVAEGCCYYGAYLKNKIKKSNEIILMDIVQLSIGIETIDGNFSIIIPKGSNIPIRKTNKYKVTNKDDDFIIKIYQGENTLAKSNKLLKEIKLKNDFEINNIISITIEVDIDGIINIKVKDILSKYQNNTIIKNDISQEDIKKYNTNFIDQIDNFNKRQNIYLLKTKINLLIKEINNNKFIKNKNLHVNHLQKKLYDIMNLSNENLLKELNNIEEKYIIKNNIFNKKKINKKFININFIKNHLDFFIEKIIKKSIKNNDNFKIIKESIEILNENNYHNIIDRIKLLEKIINLKNI
jgi:molecular chaperone DnaK (HSP70)